MSAWSVPPFTRRAPPPRAVAGPHQRPISLRPRPSRGWQVLAWAAALGLGLVWGTRPAEAADGKLLLTGGVSTIEGAAGGGLSPWALTGSYATEGQWGATAFGTRTVTQDYALNVAGAALAYDERYELSLARQDFATGRTGAALGLPGLKLHQDILGLKWRVTGDAVLDSDSWWPQIALGAEFKRTDVGDLAPTLKALGADDQGTDFYLSATKLLLGQGLLLNGTLRATKANQNGLLGFGGSAHQGYRLQPEVSLAWLLRKDLAVGAEYRAKPDNLNPSLLGNGLREDDWKDLFIAWAPSKQVSLTLAWVDLGSIVPAVVSRRQTGAYLSAQVAY